MTVKHRSLIYAHDMRYVRSVMDVKRADEMSNSSVRETENESNSPIYR